MSIILQGWSWCLPPFRHALSSRHTPYSAKLSLRLSSSHPRSGMAHFLCAWHYRFNKGWWPKGNWSRFICATLKTIYCNLKEGKGGFPILHKRHQFFACVWDKLGSVWFSFYYFTYYLNKNYVNCERTQPIHSLIQFSGAFQPQVQH